MPAELRTLSDVLKREDVASVDLAKIDVEGAELQGTEGIDCQSEQALKSCL